MKKTTTILITVLFFLSFNIQANEVTTASHSVLIPINTMFDAMREHDGKKLLAQFTEQAILERANKHDKVEISNIKKFADFISETPKHLDEQIFNIKFNESGNLANAWVPFAFYLEGKLSHCGVNSFQLIKQQNQWKIRYLMDNTYTGDCEEFIMRHKSKEK